MLGVFMYTLCCASLRQGLSMGLEPVPFGLGYAVIKSTCRTHQDFTWLLECEVPALCLHSKTEPSLQLHKAHFKSCSLRLAVK